MSNSQQRPQRPTLEITVGAPSGISRFSHEHHIKASPGSRRASLPITKDKPQQRPAVSFRPVPRAGEVDKQMEAGEDVTREQAMVHDDYAYVSD